MARRYSYVPRVLQTLVWVPTRGLLWFFCHFRVSGTQHLQGLRQAIFAVNHASELDPIILTAALSPFGRFSPMFYIVAPDRNFRGVKDFGWRRHLYQGTFFKSWGAYAPESGLRDYERALATHVAIVRDGGSLCVFPEGKMTSDGTLQEGHGGVAYLASVTGVPVVPVHIGGTFDLSARTFMRRTRTISLRFGKPSTADALQLSTAPSPGDYKTAAALVMEGIRSLIY